MDDLSQRKGISYRRDPMAMGLYRPLFDTWDERGPVPDSITPTYDLDEPIQLDHFLAPKAPIRPRDVMLIAACAFIIVFGCGAIYELVSHELAIVNQEEAIYPLSETMEDLL